MDIELIKNSLKYNKIWLAKDKYIYRSSIGEHWHLKKFIVLYKKFLVEREEINKETFIEIANNFKEFIESIKELNIKKDAENFFFLPIDFRNYKQILNFKEFDDLKEFDDSARKYFIVYLMGLGMQSGIKKAIGELLYKNKKITISEIMKFIPKIKEQEIKNKKKEGKIPRSIKDSTETIFSDFHAEIRNYRQLLSYFGILPPEEDGYEMNEIGNLIYKSNSDLIMAIWEHQKIKLRYGNPYSRPITSHNPESEYKNYEDFLDFNVSPYIAIIEVLFNLFNLDKSKAYIDFEDYKYVICREAPFDIKEVIKKINKYRSLEERDKEKIRKLFKSRPKTRKFSFDREKSSSEDFLKELSNLSYGICAYEYLETNKSIWPVIKYKSQRLEIVNSKNFIKLSKLFIWLKNYMTDSYQNLYKDISSYNSLKNLDEIYRDSKADYRLNLIKIRAHYLKNYGKDLNDFYNDTLNQWKKYISEIDYKLLIWTYSYGIYLREHGDKGDSHLSEITGIEINTLNSIIKRALTSIEKEDDSFLDNFNLKIPEYKEDLNRISDWLNSQIKDNSYSVIKQRIKKEGNDLLYSFMGGQRKRKRNMKMMLFTQKQRLNNKIVMEVRNPNYPIDCCDVCNRKFIGNEPECHHIIPFEIFGPDTPLNYTFLCKECHKIFTHKTRASQKLEAIKRLKEKGIIRKEFFERMIKENDLKPMHLDFLHLEGYINVVEKIDLLKLIKTVKFSTEDIEKLFSKIQPSKERWNRAMSVVFYYRMRFNLIMEKIRRDYQINCCDGCGKKFVKGEPECHHIIPKVIMGPEDPFNYSYLCKNCHSILTHKKKEKLKVIFDLKNRGIISKETIKQMVLSNLININHLNYLIKEKYLNQAEFDELLKLLMQIKEYWLIN